MLMEIPALYSVFKNGEVRTAPAVIAGTNISFASEPAKPEYSADELDERRPLAVVDVKGLEKRNIDDKLLKNLGFRGSDVWFLSHIYNIDDIFDCFMGNIVKTLMPYHTTKNNSVLKEAFEVSENCIPVIFVTNGTAVCRRGRLEEIGTHIREAEKIGFHEIIVFDTDSSMKRDDWTSINDRFPNIIPFVRNKDIPFEEIGFRMFISDHQR